MTIDLRVPGMPLTKFQLAEAIREMSFTELKEVGNDLAGAYEALLPNNNGEIISALWWADFMHSWAVNAVEDIGPPEQPG